MLTRACRSWSARSVIVLAYGMRLIVKERWRGHSALKNECGYVKLLIIRKLWKLSFCYLFSRLHLKLFYLMFCVWICFIDFGIISIWFIYILQQCIWKRLFYSKLSEKKLCIFISVCRSTIPLFYWSTGMGSRILNIFETSHVSRNRNFY